MRLLVLLTLPLLGSTVGLGDEPIAVKAWFTEARIKDSADSPRPAAALPAAPGTAGEGVELREAAAVENPLLRQANGYICFWIQPRWNGDDRAAHQILRIGDPERNGLLVEKAASGMLRLVMASPAKVTAARADVSHWRAGEWHHVAVAWFSKDDSPLGLPLWIDRVAVAGPVAGGNTFLNPASMTDPRVWIGDASSDAAMDELIFRERLNAEGPEGQKAIVYRDYFRTAPYTEIRITPEALRVLMRFDFPGNVRELENVIEHGFALSNGPLISVEHLPDWIVRTAAEKARPAPSLEDCERRVILDSLERNDWCRIAAAQELGIHKSTLFRKMRRLGIDPSGSNGTSSSQVSDVAAASRQKVKRI